MITGMMTPMTTTEQNDEEFMKAQDIASLVEMAQAVSTFNFLTVNILCFRPTT